jgi:hypothetical protein
MITVMSTVHRVGHALGKSNSDKASQEGVDGINRHLQGQRHYLYNINILKLSASSQKSMING